MFFLIDGPKIFGGLGVLSISDGTLWANLNVRLSGVPWKMACFED